QRRDIRTTILRYEDILREMDAVQARLGRELDFTYGGSFQDFHKYETPVALQRQLNALRPPDLATIDAWRASRHRDRIHDQFTRCPQLFELLRAYGYETDDHWFDAYHEEATPPAS